MKLITPKSIAHALGLKKLSFLNGFISWLIFRVCKLDQCNKLLIKNKQKEKLDFVSGLLHSLKINYQINESDLNKVPKDGAFVAIANHPLGAIDGLLMMHILGKKRKDLKIFGNYVLHDIEPLQKLIFPVNPFSNSNGFSGGKKGIISAISQLRSGSPVGVFPAGEVATKRNGSNITRVDGPWNDKILKLLIQENVPILPVYFHGRNSRLFYFLSKINPVLLVV